MSPYLFIAVGSWLIATAETIGFAWGAAGALAGTIASAGVQLWRGRSQSKVETATAEKLRAEGLSFIDERWEKLSRTLASRVDELEAELAVCHEEIRGLRAELALRPSA